ncbi:MAG: long-chain fatty acid--CoA ligase [Proteobacteria bacterium]|nr:long-chain fatty acid--CoA ligase [Pseudomonadota bacterium]
MAGLHGTRPAIVRPGGAIIDYARLDRAIDAMAAHAQRYGLGPSDRATLRITGPDETLGLILLLGLARLGVGTAERPPDDGTPQLRFHAGDDTLPGAIRVDEGWMQDADGEPPAMHRDPDAVMRIFSSSGTTGVPKQVVVTQAQMTQRVLLRGLAEGGAAGVRLIALGLGGNFGLQMALRTLWNGGTIVLPDGRAGPVETLNRHGVTSLVASPLSLRVLLDALPDDAGPFPALQTVHIGGSFLPPALYHQAAARLTPDIHVTMGSAEASGIASGPVGAMLDRPGAVGTIWPGVEVEAQDEDGQTLPPGEAGVLRIRSPMLARGYLTPDPAAAERFQDGWFVSSDIGTVWPDGMLTLSGRVDEIINAGGVKVHPHVIESALLKLPTVLDAAAFGVPDRAGVVQIHAAIVARARIEDAVLTAFCQHALKQIMPVAILQMRELPRNDNGKIMRETLVDLALRMRNQHAANA